jgi:hypothetical protein
MIRKDEDWLSDEIMLKKSDEIVMRVCGNAS